MCSSWQPLVVFTLRSVAAALWDTLRGLGMKALPTTASVSLSEK